MGERLPCSQVGSPLPCDRCGRLSLYQPCLDCLAKEREEGVGKKRKLLESCEYEELRSALGGLPVSWYPDLIRAMVVASYERGVFKPGGASRFVKGVEERLAEELRRKGVNG